MVQMRQIAGIRRAWQAAGSPVCEHWNLGREVDRGAHTGDLVCLACGEIFAAAEAAVLRARPRPPQ